MNRIFLLDRSGSMESILNDTIGGYNSFVKSQIADGGTMSLYLFDHEVSEVYKDVPIDKVEPLTVETFVPRGSTALLDAIGYILKKETKKSVMIILTDGEENSSTKFTHAHIKDLTEMRAKDGWDFVYLGANQDAFAAGAKLGINTACTFDCAKTPELFAAVSTAVSQASQSGEAVTLPF
jgi:Mg-chelatase subunit ChlD